MRHLMTTVALAATLLAPAAWAGRSCDAAKPGAQAIERGLVLAERTHNALEAEHTRSGLRAVILARAGQDLSKYGLRYSHLGIAYRTDGVNGQAAWRVLHKLNQCGTAEAAIYRQGLGEFFLDDLWRHEAAWVVPTREVQERLVALARDEQRSLALHHKPYNLVSYAWGQRYQQSNQWAIETLALAMDPQAGTRATAQAWLQLRGYVPTTLRLGPLTRLGGRATAANIAFDDHPNEKRFSDRIETVTVDSVFDWMQRSGLAGAPVTLRF